MITSSSKNCTSFVVGAKQSIDFKEDFMETYIPASKLSFTDAQWKAFLFIFCNKLIRNVKTLKIFSYYLPVSVCTDECVDDMKIDDANAVIHYDLPAESKTRFGNRLSCMRKYYAKYSKSEEVLAIFTS